MSDIFIWILYYFICNVKTDYSDLKLDLVWYMYVYTVLYAHLA